MTYREHLFIGHKLPLKKPSSRQTHLASSIEKRETIAQPSLSPDAKLDTVIRLGSVRKLSFLIERFEAKRQAEAKIHLQQILKEDPTFAYARLLAVRTGVSRNSGDGNAVFAIAFEEALSGGDLASIKELGRREDAVREFVIVAEAMLGDEQAGREVERMLDEQTRRLETRAVAILRRALNVIVATANGQKSRGTILLERRESVLRALRDANDVAIEPASAA